MTTDTTIDTTTLGPLEHREAMHLLADELERTLEVLDRLRPEDWSAPTDCPAWDVRRMYLHVLGACEAGASMRENLHQMRAARAHCKAHGGPLESGLSAVQVSEREQLSPTELVARLRSVAPRTVRKRTRMPALMRKLPIHVDGPVVETWRVGYLIDTIYLRDLWMHRVDAARATGIPLRLTAEHDGRIVADVVAEWARRHGRPFSLVLDGPAGGSFAANDDQRGAGGGAALELDAVEFCRTLAGRCPGSGLLTQVVPF